jgi:integrase/recombinase XerC
MIQTQVYPMSQQLIPPDDRALAVQTDQPLSQNPAAVYIASLAPGSRRTMIHALNTIADILNVPPVYEERPDQRSDKRTDDPHMAERRAKRRKKAGKDDRPDTVQENVTWLYVPWSELRYQHTEAIRAALAERLTAGGANKTLSALRQVLKRAWKLGQMTAEEYYRARDIANVSGQTERAAAGRSLAQGEISALLSTCAADSSAAGVRDAAMIALMYSTGIRRSSVVKLAVADYKADTGAIKFRKAKRNKTYTGNVINGAKRYLDDWLAVRGDRPGPLFLPVSQTGVIEFSADENGELRPLTGQAVYHILNKRAKEAGVSDFSPHDLRRTLAGDLLDQGVDIVTVKDIMGHESVDTTAGYDRRPEARKREAVDKLHIPYFGPQKPRLPGV